jgi:ubiquinone/menaquinone biosynthesis C-methylase UbiE
MSIDNQIARHQRLVRETFNAAADRFDDAPLFFWDLVGAATVQFAEVAVGDRVLDVCCGTGASALLAAERVAPGGHVVGIDVAARMLAKARDKAGVRGLCNVEFRLGDMRRLDVADGSVDVAVCALGLYFAADLGAAVAELWRTVAPGGRLVIATWGRRVLEPAHSYLLAAVAAVRPDLDLREATLSWERINRPAALLDTFVAGGVPVPQVHQETVVRSISADDLWSVVLGSGYRLLLRDLTPHAMERVRAGLRRRLVENETAEVTTDVLYARADQSSAPHPTARR